MSLKPKLILNEFRERKINIRKFKTKYLRNTTTKLQEKRTTLHPTQLTLNADLLVFSEISFFMKSVKNKTLLRRDIPS